MPRSCVFIELASQAARALGQKLSAKEARELGDFEAGRLIDLCAKELGGGYTSSHAEILAWLTFRHAEEHRRRPWGPRVRDAGIQKLAGQAMPEFRVVMAFADQLNISGTLCGNVKALEGFRLQMEAFARAILPTRLATLVHAKIRAGQIFDDYRERAQAWLTHIEMPEKDLEAEQDRVWESVPGMTPGLIERLRNKLGPFLPQTFTETMLQKVAEYFVAWHEEVDYITRRMDDPKRNRSIRAEWDRIAKIAYAHCRPMGIQWADVEEAVQETNIMLIERADEPQTGYLYRSPLWPFLAGVVVSNLMAIAARHMHEGPLAPGMGPVVDPGGRAAAARMLRLKCRAVQERFELALSFFKPEKNREQVRVIWEVSCSLTGSAKELMPRHLQLLIKSVLGRDLELNLCTTRNRLYKKIMVLNRIMVPREGQKDLPGDESIFEWLAARGQPAREEERSTVRELAAMGRIARGEKTLAWALLCRLLIDHSGVNAKDARAWVERLLLRVYDPASGDLKMRLDEVFDQAGKDTAGLKKIRGMPGTEKMLFWLAPGWYLVRLRRYPPAKAAELLKPEPSMEKNLLGMLKEISGIGPCTIGPIDKLPLL